MTGSNKILEVNSDYDMVFLIGAHIAEYFVNKLKEKIATSNLNCCIIGDGKRYLNFTEIHAALAGKIGTKTHIHIWAHGGIKPNGKHGIGIYDSDTSQESTELLQDLKKLKCQYIDMWACFAGKISIKETPKSMHLICHSSAKRATSIDMNLEGLMNSITNYNEIKKKYPKISSLKMFHFALLQKMIGSPECLVYLFQNHRFHKYIFPTPVNVTPLQLKAYQKRKILKFNTFFKKIFHRSIIYPKLDTIKQKRYLELLLILHAMRKENLKSFKKFIVEYKSMNENINTSTINGRSAFYMASENQLPQKMKLLIENHADINQAEEEHKVTPLFMIAQKNESHLLDILLKNNKIQINKTSFEGSSSLYTACEKGFSSVVTQLLLASADINQTLPNGVSPLFIACQNGHIAIVKELLKRFDIQINQSNTNGATPLYIACSMGHLEIVRELFTRKELDINKAVYNVISPLHVAVIQGHGNIVNYLLEQPNIDLSLKFNGKTALDIAREKGCEGIVQTIRNAMNKKEYYQSYFFKTKLFFSNLLKYNESFEVKQGATLS